MCFYSPCTAAASGIFLRGGKKKTDKVLSLEITEYSCFHSHFKASCVTEAPFSIRTPTGGHPSYPSVLYVDHSHQRVSLLATMNPPGVIQRWITKPSPTARKRNRRLTQATLGTKSVSILGGWQMLKCTILGREFYCMSARFTQLQTGKSDNERKVMSGDRLRLLT